MTSSKQGPTQSFDQGLARRRLRQPLAYVLVVAFVAVAAAVVAGCSSPPPAPEAEERPVREAALDPEAEAWVRRDERPISDTHPYQINDYLIYPVEWNKVEDIAPTIQELFRARYGPGLVVVPHIATNKLLIYLPPPQERERAGAAGVPSGLRTPASTRGAVTSGRSTTTRATTTRSTLRR